ncbi:ribonuclease H-like domain-containing protein [Lenzites betulinus]|nr:ribonuclease H-like domain-containing protein [Lenzites betulinus]
MLSNQSGTGCQYFYAVAKGRQPGIYMEWSGCKAQILNYNGAKYKKFPNSTEAESWIRSNVAHDVADTIMKRFLPSAPALGDTTSPEFPPRPASSMSDVQPTAAQTVSTIHGSSPSDSTTPMLQVTSSEASLTNDAWKPPADGQPWIAYTDGSSRDNGKPSAKAGVGVWWGEDDPRNISERCPGDQTNNRAELIAIIRVLETVPIDEHPLVIKSDSQYSINCLNQWILGWKRHGWRLSNGKPVLNVPLIKYADVLLEERREFAKQPVTLVKVLAHSGELGNEGADRLANTGTTMPMTPDRDWEDLIQKARARMTAVPPPSSTNNTRNTSAPNVGITSHPHNAIAAPSQPHASRTSATASSSTTTGAPPSTTARASTTILPSASSATSPTDTRQSVRSQFRQPNMLSQARNLSPVTQSHIPDGDMIYGDPNQTLTANDLKWYAECLLSDEEFLREAYDAGL